MKMLDGLQLPEGAPVLVVDCLPNKLFGQLVGVIVSLGSLMMTAMMMMMMMMMMIVMVVMILIVVQSWNPTFTCDNSQRSQKTNSSFQVE